MMDTKLQDVRIRSVPVPLVRRLKAAMAARGVQFAEWFLLMAARYAEEYEREMKS